MYDPELEAAVEKMQKSDAVMSKSDQYLLIKKFSNRQRRDGESEQQSFAKFITQDPLGRQLYRKYAETRGVSVPSNVAKSDADGDDDSTSSESEGLKKLRLMVQMLMAADSGLTKAVAMSKVLATKEGSAAFLQDRAQRLRVA